MRNQDNINMQRFFPFSFFIFLASFVFIKFIFIFFFNAAFTPRFIFELTPFYLIGMNDLQLLMISFFIVMIAAYFHIRDNRKNLVLSFIPTFIMMAGLGSAIATREISASYLIYYVVFGMTLLTILIDHTRILKMLEPMPNRKREKEPAIKKIPFPACINRFFAPLKSMWLRKKPVTSIDEPSYTQMPLPFSKDSYTKALGSKHVKPVIEASHVTSKITSYFFHKKESNIVKGANKIITNQYRKKMEANQANSEKPYETEKSLGLDSIEILDPVDINILAKVGVKTVDDLATCNPKEIVKTIDDYGLKNIVEYLEIVNKKEHISITEDMVTAWIKAAKDLKNNKNSTREVLPD